MSKNTKSVKRWIKMLKNISHKIQKLLNGTRPEAENLILVGQVDGIWSGAEVEGLHGASTGAVVVLGASGGGKVGV